MLQILFAQNPPPEPFPPREAEKGTWLLAGLGLQNKSAGKINTQRVVRVAVSAFISLNLQPHLFHCLYIIVDNAPLIKK